MSCYERLLARRQERDKLVEYAMFWLFISGALVYFGAHLLAAIQQGRF